MHRTIILTEDGSHTVAIPEMQVTYHSVHGAIQESRHVFIEAGLYRLPAGKPVHIFEMGFGTGLNALLTYMEAAQQKRAVHYTSIEQYPLAVEEAAALNYCGQLNNPDLAPVFQQFHRCGWDKEEKIGEFFTLHKTRCSLLEFQPEGYHTNLIYYDAFAPSAQPELWTTTVFQKLYNLLHPAGLLVTYCSKGDVRRAMQAAGFIVEKIPGPPGKREMVRAIKQ